MDVTFVEICLSNISSDDNLDCVVGLSARCRDQRVVDLRRAWLTPRWVTVFVWVDHLGVFVLCRAGPKSESVVV